VKSSKGKDRGELQLTIDVPKPDKKKISLKETEELLAANGMSGGGAEPSKISIDNFDVNKSYEELGLGQARLFAVHSGRQEGVEGGEEEDGDEGVEERTRRENLFPSCTLPPRFALTYVPTV
jgi:hypothetical protein